jgi:hypothetical protein
MKSGFSTLRGGTKEGTMSKQSDYTPEDWKTIAAAPILAGLYVSMADVSGPVGLAKEALAAGKATAEAAAAGDNELIRSIGETMKQSARANLPELPADAGQARGALLEACKRAAAAVKTRSPAEAEAYGKWLIAVSRKVAEGAKEGGFLGFGGMRVTEKENAALGELGSAVGVRAEG